MEMGNIRVLHDIRSRCAKARPLTRAQRDWLARSLGRFLAQDCGDLDTAFGMLNSHGGVSWRHAEAIRTRDTALRALADARFAGLRISRRARALAWMCRRYQSTCWPRDRRAARMPERYRGTAKEHLWRAFRSGAKMPVSERHLRTVLAGHSGRP